MSRLFGTVGVAPGSYTLQLGDTIHRGDGMSADCVVDVNGPVHYGVPKRGWYTAPSRWYRSQFSVRPMAPVAGPQIALDPYGTDSALQGGLRDAMTVAGIRLDILGLVAALAVGTGLAISFIAKRRK